MTERERQYYMIVLLFGNDDGSIREFPQNPDDFSECLEWFMSGWHHDNPSPQKEHNEKVMDYFIDQGRIYADFRHVYGVNLTKQICIGGNFSGCYGICRMDNPHS